MGRVDEQDVWVVVLPARTWALVQPFMADRASDFETDTEERAAFTDADDAIEHALTRAYIRAVLS